MDLRPRQVNPFLRRLECRREADATGPGGAVRRATNVAGWVALLALFGLGAGGAAAWPGGFLIGLPGAASAGLVLAGVGLLVALTRGAGAGPALGLVLPALLLLAGARLPGVGAFSGPPLLALGLAGAVAALAHARPRIARFAFFPAVLALYTIVSIRGQVQVGPRGDEPHYLMVAESILRDHDLSLEKDYAEGRYRVFHDEALEPHYRVRGKGGEIYSLHAVGLSLLILPAYALGGYPAASFLMAVLAALLAREIRELVRDWSGSDGLAEGVGWAVALSPPLVHYAGLVFTEIPAALGVAFAMRRLSRESRASPWAVGAVVAFLPWLNVRYAPLAALLLAYGVWNRRGTRDRVALLAPMAVSAAAIAAYHFVLYGFFDPRRVYGRRPEFALRTLPEGFPGLLLDQEFGLLVYAPLFALALPGFLELRRKDRRVTLVGLGLVGVVVLTAGTWPMWRGGWNPPARFLVPIVPVLALAVAAVLRRGLTAGATLLLGWSLWIGATGVVDPRLVHRDRDGTAPIFRAASGAEEWTRLLPGYVLGEPDRRRLALVWATALALALPWRHRSITAGRMAVAVLGFMAAAGVASSLSDGRSEGRDAVRLMGRPAMAVPGWALSRSWPARWGPEALDWGSLFEPHRYPEGVVLGGRLPLPPGGYELRLDGDMFGSEGPGVEVQPDRPGAPWRRAGRAAGAVLFDVREADGPVTLRLRGGGPLLLKAVDLRFQP
jgi:hypothetical protein